MEHIVYNPFFSAFFLGFFFIFSLSRFSLFLFLFLGFLFFIFPFSMFPFLVVFLFLGFLFYLSRFPRSHWPVWKSWHSGQAEGNSGLKRRWVDADKQCPGEGPAKTGEKKQLNSKNKKTQEKRCRTCNVMMAVSPQTGWAPPRNTGKV